MLSTGRARGTAHHAKLYLGDYSEGGMVVEMELAFVCTRALSQGSKPLRDTEAAAEHFGIMHPSLEVPDSSTDGEPLEPKGVDAAAANMFARKWALLGAGRPTSVLLREHIKSTRCVGAGVGDAWKMREGGRVFQQSPVVKPGEKGMLEALRLFANQIIADGWAIKRGMALFTGAVVAHRGVTAPVALGADYGCLGFYRVDVVEGSSSSHRP